MREIQLWVKGEEGEGEEGRRGGGGEGGEKLERGKDEWGEERKEGDRVERR